MKLLNLICALMLVASVAFADAPPTFPTTFYGVITTTGGSLGGQTIQATLGASTASAIVGSTALYNCGADTCNYYLTISRASGDTTSTNVVFSMNGNPIGNGTFDANAPVRRDFSVPASDLNGAVVGSSSDITSNSWHALA